MPGHKQTDTDRPIFLLGVGRCGSTSLQLQLSRIDDVWIWGEHGAILRTLFGWGEEVRNQPDLIRFSFEVDHKDLRRFVEKPFSENPTHLAWLNGFSQEAFSDVERNAIRSLMKPNLPRGKRRWGFKEIRYGVEDDVPAQLLRLFPGAKIVHTIRHPARNVESAIVEWSLAELKAAEEASDVLAIVQLYEYYASRWLKSATYFQGLGAKHDGRVFTTRLEHRSGEMKDLCDFLEVNPAQVLGDDAEKINFGPAIAQKENEKYLELIRDVGRRFAPRFADVAKFYGYEDPK